MATLVVNAKYVGGVDSEELQEEIEAEMNQHELDEEDMQDGGISEEAEEE